MWQFEVPNAPCGVERQPLVNPILCPLLVPNAPCGVERNVLQDAFYSVSFVPNAPCGVESYQSSSLQF